MGQIFKRIQPKTQPESISQETVDNIISALKMGLSETDIFKEYGIKIAYTREVLRDVNNLELQILKILQSGDFTNEASAVSKLKADLVDPAVIIKEFKKYYPTYRVNRTWAQCLNELEITATGLEPEDPEIPEEPVEPEELPGE
jgi:hypothetical protein